MTEQAQGGKPMTPLGYAKTELGVTLSHMRDELTKEDRTRLSEMAIEEMATIEAEGAMSA